MKIKIPQIAMLGILFTVLLGCGDKKEERRSQPIEVKVQKIGAHDNTQHGNQLSYSGKIQAEKTVNLTFQVSGTVEQIPVKIGDFLEKGTLVAAIDPTMYQNQYKAKKAQAQLAKENYQRINEVFQKGSIAEIKMLEARSKYDQAEAATNAAYQDLKHTKLHAPISGYVGTKMLEAGDVAAPGKPVIQLLDIHSVKAVVPIPDDEINTYKVGDSALVTVDALQNQETPGQISEVSVNSSQGNPVYTAKIDLKNPLQHIKPGMSCKVYLKNKNAKQAQNPEYIIPIKSISVTEDGRHFVFLVNKNKAEKHFVKTGKLYDNGIAITDGLQSGDQLIVSGYHKLTNHTPIKIAH